MLKVNIYQQQKFHDYLYILLTDNIMDTASKGLKECLFKSFEPFELNDAILWAFKGRVKVQRET